MPPPMTTPPSGRRKSDLDRLLSAILDDDRSGVRELINKESWLSTGLVDEARLYESKLVHWLYVNDTGLHRRPGIDLGLRHFIWLRRIRDEAGAEIRRRRRRSDGSSNR